MTTVRRSRVRALLGAIVLVVVLIVAACSGAASSPGSSSSAPPSPAGPPHEIGGRATAGPVCPVERIPPDPSCAARPVAGAVIVIQDASGREAARTTTDADGRYLVYVPAGDYVVVGQPVKGLMGTPQPQPVTTGAGTTVADLSYDTGIR